MFGASNNAKNATNQMQYVANNAISTADALGGKGSSLLNLGNANVSSGTNYFNTLLHGNQANTAALLAPDVARIRGANQNALQAISTLSPRGGGRESSLFQAAYAPTNAITNLFNTQRGTAAGNLANIGLQQGNLGANLYGIGNQYYGTGLGADQAISSAELARQQLKMQGYSGLGQGLFNLATTPLGSSGRTIAGRIGGLFGF